MGFNASGAPKATVAPPKKTGPKKPTIQEASKFEERQEGLNGIGQLGTGLCMATGQYADAGAIGMHWPNVSRELASLSGRYEAVGNVVDKAIALGPFAGLLAAVMPFALQIAVNHGRLDGGAMASFGVMPKEALEAQGQASAIRMVAQARQQQAAAEAELAAAQQEMASTQNGSAPRIPQDVMA